MTDGIIQKVFNKHKNKPRSKFYGRTNVPKDVNELQEELISEIKKESKPILLPENTGRYVIDCNKLIGDNE